jgi:hypothetical protein
VVGRVLVGMVLGVMALTKEGRMYAVVGIVILALSVCLSGCMDVAQWQLRTFYGLDCRTEKLVAGKCVPVKKGSTDVHTAQP